MRLFVLVALAVGAGAASASAAELPVLELPTVREQAVVRDHHGRLMLMVRTVTVEGPVGAHVLMECVKCLRWPRETVERDPRPGVEKYTGVDWMLRAANRVKLYVTKSGTVGRYMTLKAAEPLRRRKLVTVAKGCLAHGVRPIACPAPATEKQATTERKPESQSTPEVTTMKAETVGGLTHTHTDYREAGGTEGQIIYSGETVEVSCRVEGYEVEDGDTWWYQIASPPWNGLYYATADAFYNNGEKSGTLIGTPHVDLTVKEC